MPTSGPTNFALQKPHSGVSIGVDVRVVADALEEVRCKGCKRLLFKGELRGEIKCPKCGHVARF